MGHKYDSLFATITSVEHAMIRPCDGDACGNVFVIDPKGPFCRCLRLAYTTTIQV